jgi:hypothetical protein
VLDDREGGGARVKLVFHPHDAKAPAVKSVAQVEA